MQTTGCCVSIHSTNVVPVPSECNPNRIGSFSSSSINDMWTTNLFLAGILAFSVGNAYVTEKPVDADLIPNHEKVHKQCLAMSGADYKELNKVLEEGQFSEDDRIKKYFSCTRIISEILSRGPDFNERKIRTNSPSTVTESELKITKEYKREASESGFPGESNLH
ncbi:hypothetical protein JTB14_038385 [Gonioctena quinquepunctata]|nr:hypothetical protein JTB14_038385 [Gonioctena quinquepunctata]